MKWAGTGFADNFLCFEGSSTKELAGLSDLVEVARQAADRVAKPQEPLEDGFGLFFGSAEWLFLQQGETRLKILLSERLLIFC